MSGRRSSRKGSSYELAVVKWLRARGRHVVKAERGNPTGDVIGIPHVVVECKNHAKLEIGAWVAQLTKEVERAGAEHGVVVVKRRGTTDVGQHYILTTADDYERLLREAGYV